MYEDMLNDSILINANHSNYGVYKFPIEYGKTYNFSPTSLPLFFDNYSYFITNEYGMCLSQKDVVSISSITIDDPDAPAYIYLFWDMENGEFKDKYFYEAGGSKQPLSDYIENSLENKADKEGFNIQKISENSHAEGAYTYAGTKAFKITALRGTTGGIGYYTLDSVEGITVNMAYSAVTQEAAYNQGQITAINGNEVTVTNYPGYALNTATDNPSAYNMYNLFIIVDHPELGTVDAGFNAHTEGHKTYAAQVDTHAEGRNTKALGKYAHTEGIDTQAGHASHAEGNSSTALSVCSHAEGERTQANGRVSHSEGFKTQANGPYSHAEGGETVASGQNSHAENFKTKATGLSSHAEGESTEATGAYSHAQGYQTKATGLTSHAEGESTEASGQNSHAEGRNTKATAYATHAEGNGAQAIGASSHAEGQLTVANGLVSHTEGFKTITRADASYSHAEGMETIATAQGQHVEGKYNIEDTNKKYAHIIGNGTNTNNRSNAHTVDWQGNAWYAGKITSEGVPVNDKDLTNKKYVDNKINGIDLSSKADKIHTHLIEDIYVSSIDLFPNQGVCVNRYGPAFGEVGSKIWTSTNDYYFCYRFPIAIGKTYKFSDPMDDPYYQDSILIADENEICLEILSKRNTVTINNKNAAYIYINWTYPPNGINENNFGDQYFIEETSLAIDTELSESSMNPVANSTITNALNNLNVPVDTKLSSISINPVQNKVITAALSEKAPLNSERNSVSGSTIVINNIHPVEHNVNVQLDSTDSVDLSTLKLKTFGKNLFDPQVIINFSCSTIEPDGAIKLVNPIGNEINNNKIYVNHKNSDGPLILSYKYKTENPSSTSGLRFRAHYKEITNEPYIGAAGAADYTEVVFNSITNSSYANYTLEYFYTECGSTNTTWIKDIQLEFNEQTEYMPYICKEYTPNEDGSFGEVKSISPIMILKTDVDNVIINADYITNMGMLDLLDSKLDITGTASKAIADAEGNTITETYMTKGEMSNKAPIVSERTTVNGPTLILEDVAEVDDVLNVQLLASEGTKLPNLKVSGRNLFDPEILVSEGAVLQEDGTYYFAKCTTKNTVVFKNNGTAGQLTLTYKVKTLNASGSNGQRFRVCYANSTKVSIGAINSVNDYTEVTFATNKNLIVDRIELDYGTAGNSTWIKDIQLEFGAVYDSTLLPIPYCNKGYIPYCGLSYIANEDGVVENVNAIYPYMVLRTESENVDISVNYINNIGINDLLTKYVLKTEYNELLAKTQKLENKLNSCITVTFSSYSSGTSDGGGNKAELIVNNQIYKEIIGSKIYKDAQTVVVPANSEIKLNLSNMHNTEAAQAYLIIDGVQTTYIIDELITLYTSGNKIPQFIEVKLSAGDM